jgi:chaperonin cofactor prefoldin
MIDPHAKLVEALDHAQEYLDLAIKAQDRGEREFYERICELYMRIAQELRRRSTNRLCRPTP